jgi:hypothetical protein
MTLTVQTLLVESRVDDEADRAGVSEAAAAAVGAAAINFSRCFQNLRHFDSSSMIA